MPNSAEIEFNETDLSFDVANIIDGVAGVMGVTERGPVMRPDLLITSWALYNRYYGGFMDGNDFPLLCFRALTYYGLQLRVCGIRHFTDITNVNSLTAVVPSLQILKSPVVAPLGTPATPTVVVTADGILADGTYAYKIIGVNLNGRTLPSIGANGVQNSGGTGKATITWAALAGAVSYQVQRVIGGVTVYFNTNTNSFVDDGSLAGDAGTVPGADGTGRAAVNIANINPKFPGVKYNSLKFITKNPSNGIAGYFDVQMYLLGSDNITPDATTVENYPNLKVDDNQPVIGQHWADKIKQNSYLVDIGYLDLSTNAGLLPVLGTLAFADGADGGTPTQADYAGIPSNKTGIYSFDDQDDMMYISAPASIDSNIANAGASYASQRADLVYFVHLDHTLVDPASIVLARQAVVNADSYTAFFTGGVKITDPVSGATRTISELGDVLGIHALSDENFGPQYSAAASTRGLAKAVLGSGNNFGAKGNYALLNQLANAQINCMITSNGKTYISGNFTGFISASGVTSKLSYLSIRKMIINVKDVLDGPLALWIEEPADIPTFAGIYREVLPFLENLKTNRSVYDYRWYGDQDVTDISKIKINTPQGLDEGKVVAQLWLKPINSTQFIIININIVNSAYNFEDSSLN